MAFKLKSGNNPTFKEMGSSPLKTASPLKVEEKAYGGDKTWSEGQKASGGKLNELVAKRKTLEKGSREWNITQNKINEALGSKKRYDVGDEPTATSKTNKVTGRTTTTTSPNERGEKDSVTTTRKGRLTKTVDQENLSTYDPKTQTGSSGLGMKETTQRYKRSGDAKRRSKTTYSMGTDTTADDIVQIKKKARKIGGRAVTKTKGGTTGAKSKTVVRGEKGGRWTQKDKSKDAAGTVTKTKHKKVGTSVTRQRKKGQLFGRKVDIDYS